MVPTTHLDESGLTADQRYVVALRRDFAREEIEAGTSD